MGELIEYPSNGERASGYLAVPEAGSGPGVHRDPGVVGAGPAHHRLADRFAAEGFVALAPDLYGGKKTTEPDEAGKEMMALQIPKATKDMSGAVDELLRRSARTRSGSSGSAWAGGWRSSSLPHAPTPWRPACRSTG